MNVLAITGRLTANVELKETADGTTVATFSVAVQRPFTRDKVDFINVIAWRKLAEFVADYFHKGDPIAVDGYLTQRSYETKEGNKRTVYEMVANNCNFCASRNEKTETQGTEEQVRLEAIEDDDLPF